MAGGQEWAVSCPLPLPCSVQTHPAGVSLPGARAHFSPGWASGPVRGGPLKARPGCVPDLGQAAPGAHRPHSGVAQGCQGRVGREEGPYGVLTAPDGVGCQPRPQWAPRTPPPRQAPHLSQPLPGRPGSQGRWGRPGERSGCPPKSLWFGADGYLAEQLVGLRGLYLKVAGRLKIGELQSDRGVAAGSPQQHLAPAPAHGPQAGQGRGAPRPGARGGIRLGGRTADQVPAGPVMLSPPPPGQPRPEQPASHRLTAPCVGHVPSGRRGARLGCCSPPGRLPQPRGSPGSGLASRLPEPPVPPCRRRSVWGSLPALPTRGFSGQTGARCPWRGRGGGLPWPPAGESSSHPGI